MKAFYFSGLLICLVTMLTTESSAADPITTPTQQERALSQELERLKREAAEVKRQLDRIRHATFRADSEVAEKTVAFQAVDSEPSSKNALSSFIRKVKLQQSVFDKDAFQKPASISYTHPSDSPSSFAVDAGLGVELQPKFFPWGDTLSSSVGVDYHRNTTVGALKNLFQVGGQFEDTHGFAATSGLLLDTAGDAAYKVDDIRHIRTAEGSLKVHPVFTFEKMGVPALSFLNTDNYHRTGCVRWRWEPFVGTQYERTVQSGSGAASGHHLLLNYGAEFLAYPFFSSIGRKVEITASYKGWQSFDHTGVFSEERNSSFFETQFTYLFVESNPIQVGAETSKTLDMGITLKYQNGDNLETGDKHLDVFSIALTGRF